MARLTIVIGVLLTLLGVAVYGGLAWSHGDDPSVTALIPALVGIPVLLLGCVAMKESLRMHAMHVVAMLSLLGFALSAGRLAMQWARQQSVSPPALLSLVGMAVLCGFLLIACIRSFVRARLNRTETPGD